jgi:hypothetical protein
MEVKMGGLPIVMTIGGLFLAATACGGTQVERIRVMNSDYVIEIEKRHAHLFLAEYDFTLRLKLGTKVLDEAEMTGDSGGLSRIDVIKLSGNRLAFRDHAQAKCVTQGGKKLDNCTADTGGRKIGHFDFDASRRWRYIDQDLGG